MWRDGALRRRGIKRDAAATGVPTIRGGKHMSKLGSVVEAVENYNKHVSR